MGKENVLVGKGKSTLLCSVESIGHYVDWSERKLSDEEWKKKARYDIDSGYCLVYGKCI